MVRRLICLPCLVMTAWTLTLGWLITNDRYTHFLAPKFQILIYASAVLLGLFTLGTAIQPPEKNKNQLIKGLILILPILFILAAGEATLGNFAVSKRGITSGQTLGSGDQAGTVETPAVPQEKPISEAQSEPAHTAAQTLPPQAGDLPRITITQLIKNWEDYDGKEISLEGIFSQTVVGNEDLSAVFRYLITCCVADALPVGIFMDKVEVEGLSSDDWVQASGRVSKVELEGYSVIFMAPALVEKQKKPSKNAAYLFN